MVRKNVYYKKTDYQKLIVNLVKKKYLSLLVGIFVSFLVSSFLYNQFLSAKISQLNLKKINFSFLTNNKKITNPLKNKKIKKEKKEEKDYRLYTVAEGDSLSFIAQKFYGDIYKWPVILRYNNIDNPDKIEVGMVLKIPKNTQ